MWPDFAGRVIGRRRMDSGRICRVDIWSLGQICGYEDDILVKKALQHFLSKLR